MNNDFQPGDLYNKFQAKKKKSHEKKKHKNWIAGAIKKPGALHAELGVPKGTKIPAKKLAMAAKKGGTEGKRARLAETLKGFHKGKKHTKKHKFTKKNDHDADDMKKGHKKMKTMCKKHKKSMCKMCGK